MIIESIFAYIFYSKHYKYVLKLTYVEINEENVYDLIREGDLLHDGSEPSFEICSSVEEAMAIKTKAE